MSKSIRVYALDSKEHKNLELAAELLTKASPNGVVYSVNETYFDFGLDWMWTTIIAVKPEDGVRYQALSPVSHERLVFASTEDVADVVADIRSGKFWSDK